MAEKEKSPIKTEAITKNNNDKIEWHYFDENSKAIHLAKEVFKGKQRIKFYPYSYRESIGLKAKKIKIVEFKGWNNITDIPTGVRSGERLRITSGSNKILLANLYRKYPKLEKLIFSKNGKTRFSEKSATFNWVDYEGIVRAVNKETKTYETRRKTALTNQLAELTSDFEARKTSLSRGSLEHFMSLYNENITLSKGDIDSILNILSLAPASNISITENFIQTKDKINKAYLEDVIDQFDNLLKYSGDNEKKWQELFDDHGWILANLFPFQVILYKKEAFVGGKTIKNDKGRVVDFLFQNGFEDNYALLEIKTHNTKLISSTVYREPDAYPMHGDLSGAISQCLDQKNVFLSEMGQKYKILDPKSVLIVGQKSKLNESQSKSFELLRSNQKNVDIVTYDELRAKLIGLKDIFNS